MKGTVQPRGIIATVITPFDAEGNVDFQSLEREYQWGLDTGIAGFLVPSGASELKYLSEEEQTKLFLTARKIVGNKMFLMPNLPGPGEEDVINQAKKYLDLGADGININTHWSPRKGPEEEFVNLVKRIDRELHPNFLCVQDDDAESLTGIPVELAARLFYEVESLRAIKCEVGRATPKYTAVKDATNGDMLVYGGGYSHYALEGYDRGLDGLMPSGMFEIFHNIYRLYHEKDRAVAEKLYHDSLPCVLFTRQDWSINRIFHKYYMKRIGVFNTTYSRDPIDAYDKYTIRFREEMIDRALDIVRNMEDYWK